jgi:hypothetical protein
LKTEDFLRELPSKSLVALYVRNLARSGDLAHDLAAHFRIVRNSEQIADIMQQVCDTDLEAGILTKSALHMKESQDGVLKGVEMVKSHTAVCVHVVVVWLLKKKKKSVPFCYMYM